MESLLLFCRALSSPTMCRFIPALSVTGLYLVVECGVRTVLQWQRTWSHPELKFIEDVYNEKHAGRYHRAFGQPWAFERPEAGCC
jgi:hypothetical protein